MAKEETINKFTFYRNYYEIIKCLSDKDRLIMYDSIIKYMFEDKEPDLKNLLNGIWVNLKMPLDTNKKNINNGLKGGAPIGNQNALKETTQKQPKNNPKTTQGSTQKQANNISYFLFLISNNKYKYIIYNNNIYNIIIEWLKYKQERKEIYKEIGLQSLLTQIENQIDIYGENEVVNLITECMANNYKGIIFDKLKNKNKKAERKLPEWFNKDIENQEATKEDKEEMQKLLKQFK